MTVDPEAFRDVLAQWPSGVTVVTTLTAEGEHRGMTASSFSSVSLTPPLVSVCLDKKLYTHGLLEQSGVFGVNVLAKDQAIVARRFAGMLPGVEDRFENETWSTAETGVRLLESALGWVDCKVVHRYEGGDHTIFVGEVLQAHTARRTAPLLFHSRGWGQFADVLPDVASLSDTRTLVELGRLDRHREVPAVLDALTGAGVRTRVADLVAQPDASTTLASLAANERSHLTSALVGDRLQAQRALERAVGSVEVTIDPAFATSRARALAAVDGIEGQAVVHLIDPFGAQRDEVLTLIDELSSAGVREIVLPDHDGRATALGVRALLQEAVALARPTPLRLQLHDRDRLGLVKALTALKSGVRDYDSAIGGLGGSVATEDLIRLFATVDVDAAVDGEGLAELSARLLDARPTEMPANPPAPSTATP